MIGDKCRESSKSYRNPAPDDIFRNAPAINEISVYAFYRINTGGNL